jgi:hypothetical protein
MFMIVWAIFLNTVDNFTKPWLIGFDIARTMSLTTWAFLAGFLRSASWVVYLTDLNRDHVHIVPDMAHCRR